MQRIVAPGLLSIVPIPIIPLQTRPQPLATSPYLFLPQCAIIINHAKKSNNSQSITSGALYHLVATYSVINPFPPLGPTSGGGAAADRARPKSQIFRSQLALSRRFDGLRSRWRTFAVCSALRPRTVCRRRERVSLGME